MLQVKFYDSVPDNLLKFAVIIAKSADNWTYPEIQPILLHSVDEILHGKENKKE